MLGSGKEKAVWMATFQHGEEREQTLLPSSFVSKWLVVLVFCDSDQRISSFFIPFDTLDGDSFRRLRVVVDHFQKN